MKYANAQQSSISTGFGIGNARRGSRIQVNICVQNYYKKKIQAVIKSKKEVLISDLSEEQQYYIDVLTARSDNHNLAMDYNTQNILNANENRVIYLSYVEGYSTAEIARMSNRTRQAVN